MPNDTEISVYIGDEDGVKRYSCSCGGKGSTENIMAAAEAHNNTQHGGTYTIIDNRPYSL